MQKARMAEMPDDYHGFWETDDDWRPYMRLGLEATEKIDKLEKAHKQKDELHTLQIKPMGDVDEFHENFFPPCVSSYFAHL